jgi:hypothetical protein
MLINATEHGSARISAGNSSNGSRSCRLEKCFLWQALLWPLGCSRLRWAGWTAGLDISISARYFRAGLEQAVVGGVEPTPLAGSIHLDTRGMGVTPTPEIRTCGPPTAIGVSWSVPLWLSLS